MAIFLYDPDTVNADALRIIATRGYTCIKLTDNPEHFWATMRSVPAGQNFALLSHGDSDGPLLVKGDSGADLSADDDMLILANFLIGNRSAFILLSCETGSGDFGAKLEAAGERGLVFVAPIGLASFRASSQSVSVYSVDPKDNSKYLGWIGSEQLCPTRKTKPLDF